MYGLLTDAELFDDCTVSFNIVFLKVSEKVSSVTYHLEKTAIGMAILRVNLLVSIELDDSGGEERNLYLGRACVTLVNCVVLHNLLL